MHNMIIALIKSVVKFNAPQTLTAAKDFLLIATNPPMLVIIPLAPKIGRKYIKNTVKFDFTNIPPLNTIKIPKPKQRIVAIKSKIKNVLAAAFI